MMNADDAKQVDDSQAKYLSFLSHDLRGALNSVLLMIEVLRRDLAGAEQFTQSLDDLDVMKRTILETVGTMERFLHAERLRKGLFVLRPALMDLKQFIAGVAQQFSYQAKEKGLNLEIDLPPGTTIRTDREAMLMIMQNLISNAIKYSEKGTVKIGCKDCGPGKIGPITLFVADEGSGIAPEKLDKIFAPFVRGDTHGQQGEGLGLSIARQGAQMLGAKLWAESELGKGTTFYLELGEEKKT